MEDAEVDAQEHAQKLALGVEQIAKAPQEQLELHAVIVQLLAKNLAWAKQLVYHNV